MADSYADSGIRKRLIEAGLTELLEHGSGDFSLRRVALAAQVSCAAPYRHFKDKDELVRAVIAEIRENWFLLANEVGAIFDVGTKEHVSELLVACVRFWIGGNNFAPFLKAGEILGFDEPIIDAVAAYAKTTGIAEDEAAELTSTLLSLTYGAVTLAVSGRLDANSAADNLRRQVSGLI